MRAITLVVALAACGDDGNTVCTRGTTFGSDDGCNTCTCEDNGVAACTEKSCICTATETCGRTEGPHCGDVCCKPGEQCIDDVCVCGNTKAGCGPDFECMRIGTATCGVECVLP